MNIDSLRYFAAVAEHKSFSKAAESLHITQPALSKSLQRLEKELGVSLFLRTTTSVALTEVGEACLREARQLLHHADAILDLTGEQARGDHGTLVIGHNGGEGVFLYPIVNAILLQYPKIEIRLHKEPNSHLLKHALDLRLDLFFISDSSVVGSDPNLSFLPVPGNMTQIIVPKSHRFANRNRVFLSECEEEAFVLWPDIGLPGISEKLFQACERCGFPLKLAGEIGNKEELLVAILSGKGIGISDSADDGSYDETRISRVTLCCDYDPAVPLYQLTICWNRRNKNPCLQPALKVIRAYLSAEGAG